MNSTKVLWNDFHLFTAQFIHKMFSLFPRCSKSYGLSISDIFLCLNVPNTALFIGSLLLRMQHNAAGSIICWRHGCAADSLADRSLSRSRSSQPFSSLYWIQYVFFNQWLIELLKFYEYSLFVKQLIDIISSFFDEAWNCLCHVVWSLIFKLLDEN